MNSKEDNPGAVLVNTLLTNNNYFTWKHAMTRALIAKKKLKFIESNPPNKGSANYESWKETDYLMTAWILNAIHKDHSESFVFATSAKALWEDLAQRYGDKNSPMLFKIKRQLSRVTQGNQSVCAYFTSLKRLWDELFLLRPIPECQYGMINKCSCNAFKRLTDMMEEDKLMELLSGLNEQYEHVINQILLTEPLANVNKAFSMVTKIEKQKEISNKSQLKFSNFTTKPSSINTRSNGGGFKGNIDEGYEDRSQLHCDLCKRWRHTRSECFKMVGYPDWWPNKKKKGYQGRSGSKKGKGSRSTTKANAVKMKDSPLTDSNSDEKESESNNTSQMIQELYKMMKGKEKLQQSKSSNNSEFSAFAGFSRFSGNVSQHLDADMNPDSESYWIIDSGATSHMSPKFHQFHNDKTIYQQ